MAISAFLGLLFIAALHCGCATTRAGLTREQGIYTVSTNIVSGVQSFVPFLPAPVATPVEVLLGVASAALGAWNLHQQKSIKALRNGKSQPTTDSLTKAAPAVPATPAQPPTSPTPA